MNNDRRKRIDAVLKVLQAVTIDEDLASDVESIAEEEREAFDNMPESLQQGERGQNCEAAADALDKAKDAIGELADKIQEAIDKLEEARDL